MLVVGNSQLAFPGAAKQIYTHSWQCLNTIKRTRINTLANAQRSTPPYKEQIILLETENILANQNPSFFKMQAIDQSQPLMYLVESALLQQICNVRESNPHFSISIDDESCRNNHSLRLALVDDSCVETHFVTSSTCVEIHTEYLFIHQLPYVE